MVLVHLEDLQDIENFIGRFADHRKAPLSVNQQIWEAKRLMKRITAARYAYKGEGEKEGEVEGERGAEDGTRTIPPETTPK